MDVKSRKCFFNVDIKKASNNAKIKVWQSGRDNLVSMFDDFKGMTWSISKSFDAVFREVYQEKVFMWWMPFTHIHWSGKKIENKFVLNKFSATFIFLGLSVHEIIFHIISILTRFTWRRIVLFSTQLLIFPWEMYIFARKYSDFLNISKRSIQWLNKNSKYMPINRLYSLWNNGAVSGTGFWKIMWTFFPYSTILYENSH